MTKNGDFDLQAMEKRVENFLIGQTNAKDASSVKGTSRFSSNDKKLMRDLWVAEKDGNIERRRNNRALAQAVKQTQSLMPTEQAERAVKEIRKKSKDDFVLSKPELREDDDSVLFALYQCQNWSHLAKAQRIISHNETRLAHFVAKHCVKDKSTKALTKPLLRPALMSGANASISSAKKKRKQVTAHKNGKKIDLLTDVHHRRLENFVERREKFAARTLPHESADQTLNNLLQQRKRKRSSSKLDDTKFTGTQKEATKKRRIEN